MSTEPQPITPVPELAPLDHEEIDTLFTRLAGQPPAPLNAPSDERPPVEAPADPPE